jgi:Glycosyl hydrolase family 92 N-terminal domain
MPDRNAGGGYGYGDEQLTGYSLTHISGPGCGAAGDVPILPMTGTMPAGDPNSYTTSFTNSGEVAQDGVLFGNVVVARMPYRNCGGGAQSINTYLFAQTIPVDGSKTVASVTLPGDGANGAIGIWTLSAEAARNLPVGAAPRRLRPSWPARRRPVTSRRRPGPPPPDHP